MIPRPGEVSVLGIGLLCPAGIGTAGAGLARPGAVPGFLPQAWVANRKNLKLMARSVQLGMAAVGMAVGTFPALADVPPHRRAFYTGSNPLAGDFDDLRPALEEATDPGGRFELGRFARAGIPLIHPLWLVKGLSNNVLGFASAQHDFQGPNANYCHDEASGVIALWEAAQALLAGQADIALAGSADCVLGAEVLMPGRPLGEGAAFFLLAPPHVPAPWRLRLPSSAPPDPLDEASLGWLGVAGPTVHLARAALGGRCPATVAGAGCAVTLFTT